MANGDDLQYSEMAFPVLWRVLELQLLNETRSDRLDAPVTRNGCFDTLKSLGRGLLAIPRHSFVPGKCTLPSARGGGRYGSLCGGSLG
jgi:hypothetical protein